MWRSCWTCSGTPHKPKVREGGLGLKGFGGLGFSAVLGEVLRADKSFRARSSGALGFTLGFGSGL